MSLLIGVQPLWGQNYVPGEVIVKYKPGTSSLSVSGKISNSFVVRGVYSAVGMQKIAMKGSGDVNAFIDELRKDPNVEFAEPNFYLSKPIDASDNPQIYSQSDMESMSSGGSYIQSYANIHVQEAWDQMIPLSQNPNPIVVAVIDTGVDYTHPVFTAANAIWTNTEEIANNGIDDDHNGYIDDVHGWNFHANTNDPMDDDNHGTHVAGIVFGISQALTDTSAARVKIMPLKFLGADGSGTTSSAIAAINYAVNNGARVINNSWGGEAYSQALHDAITAAYNEGVFVTAAAGNYSSNNDSKPLYPATYPVPGLMSVAASNDFDNLASFSNYGVSTVHVGSPGVAIYSTIPNNSYRYMNGTSMASPLVAGIAAMMFREAPQLTGYQIKALLVGSGEVKSNLATKLSSSARIDVYDAIMAAKNETNTAAYQPSYVAANATGRGPDGEVSGGGGCGTVRLISATGGAAGGSNTLIAIVFAIALIPVVAWTILRSRIKKPKDNRKHERFLMNSAITVMAGGQELVGQMKTISVGGLSFNAEQMLEKGGIVTIKIHSPEGQEEIQVQGHIVWSQANAAYGVQFDRAPVSIIQRWTKALLKAS